MSHLALALILTLQMTGLWGHVSNHTKLRIINSAAAIVPANPQPPVVINMPLPSQIGTTLPNLSGGSAYALDRTSGVQLYAHDAANKRPLASITKLVTILTVLSRHSINETVTVGQLPSYNADAELMGLHQGQQFKLGDLVKAVLIPSDNDAADALALYDSGNITKFAAQMNIKLAQWGIKDARFSNASGLVDAGNYTTAVALTRIAQLALVNPIIRKTAAMQSATITSTAGESYDLETTNKLLATGQFYGIKTGYTLQAGECFVGLAHVNGHEIITVILGSNDRFGDTQRLTNWIGTNWQWL